LVELPFSGAPWLAPSTRVLVVFLCADERDFRDQSGLSLSGAALVREATMEVLDWLEECSFEWDMYVDLPANTVRYCFRSLADASAFAQRFGRAAERRAVAGGH
jgi:hypothetical protein